MEKFAKCDYDLVFLDHRMPNMDGMETMEEIKKRFADKLNNVPVISLTANAAMGAKEMYVAAGFSDYLAKPVMPDELDAMLVKFLPKDKVCQVKDDDQNSENTSLPDWLKEIKLIDTSKGVMFRGGAEEYLEALKIFAASIMERAADIEKFECEGDITKLRCPPLLKWGCQSEDGGSLNLPPPARFVEMLIKVNFFSF